MVEKVKKESKGKKFADAFFGICAEKLQFLMDEYGFRETDRTDTYNSFYEVIYQNETTAVKVYFERRDMYVSVQVCRLVGGKLQKDPETLTPSTEWTCFQVDVLLMVRAPAYDQRPFLLAEEARSHEEVAEGIAVVLANYADALRAHGQDVLRGDFSVFPQLDRIAKEGARERQAWYEETTAWMNKRIE